MGGVRSPRSSPSSSSSPSSPASTLTLRSSANRTLSPFLLAIRSITSWSCAAVRAVRALLRLPVLLFPNSQRRAWNVWKCDPKLVNVSLRVNGAPNSKGGQLQSPLLNLVADLPKHLEKNMPMMLSLMMMMWMVIMRIEKILPCLCLSCLGRFCPPVLPSRISPLVLVLPVVASIQTEP